MRYTVVPDPLGLSSEDIGLESGIMLSIRQDDQCEIT
jgi:hypothetical protein